MFVFVFELAFALASSGSIISSRGFPPDRRGTERLEEEEGATAAGKLAEAGVDKNFTKSVGDKLKPGNSALFVLVRSVTADKVLPELSKFGGTVVQTNLSKKAEAELQKQLSQGETTNARNHMAAA